MTTSQRASDPVLAELLQMVTETNGILKSHMHDHDLNHQALEGKLTTIHSDITELYGGFPEGDPEGHKSFHVSYIKRMEERAEFWKKMTYELSKYGLLGFLGWAVYVLWEALLHGPGK